MTDFIDSLKDIKKEMLKEQNIAVSEESGPEDLEAKTKRLQAEVSEFLKGASLQK